MTRTRPRPLTPRQQQLLDTITSMTETRGFPPTVREVAKSMRVHPSRVKQLATATAAKGALVREARAARAWHVPAASARRR